MASFRKVGKKTEASVCVNGKRRSKTFDTQAKAKSWAVDMEEELSSLADGVSLTHTLGDALAEYLDKVSIKKKGYKKEANFISALQKRKIAQLLLNELELSHFEEFIEERQKDKVKPSTINRELNVISHCLTTCRRWKWMTKNPMKDLQRPKDPPPRDRRVSDEELEQLAFALNYDETQPITQKKQRVYLAFEFAIETAMRLSEICRLTNEHINWKKRTAYLPETKNGRPRTVPLSSRAIAILKRLPKTEEPVFELKETTTDTLFRKAKAKTLIKNLHFHDSRHEATTRLAQKNTYLRDNLRDFTGALREFTGWHLLEK